MYHEHLMVIAENWCRMEVYCRADEELSLVSNHALSISVTFHLKVLAGACLGVAQCCHSI